MFRRSISAIAAASFSVVAAPPPERRTLWCADEAKCDAVNVAYSAFRRRLFLERPQLLSMPDQGESMAYMEWRNLRDRESEGELESSSVHPPQRTPSSASFWTPSPRHVGGGDNNGSASRNARQAAALARRTSA